MSRRFLPEKGTPEAEELAKLYPTANREQLEYWTKKYGYKNVKGLCDAMFNRLDVQRKGVLPVAEEETSTSPQIIIPDIKLKEFIPVENTTKGDPETQVLVLSDHHGGEITPTFNPDIYKKRMETLFKNTIIITHLHRNMYPVNDLVILIAGDMVHGENPKQGAKLEQTAYGAQRQIYDLVMPELLNLILSFKQEFKNIKIYCVRGNHGRYNKLAPSTSNWDILLYKSLEVALKPHNITVSISNDFCNIVDISGFKFLLFHGDQVRTTQGIPYFALIRKVLSWYITFGGVNYAICGHWHKDDFLRISAKTKLFLNASMVSDDPFALEVIGTSSIPSQWTFGVHERNGVTWAYSILLDDKFRPRKCD